MSLSEKKAFPTAEEIAAWKAKHGTVQKVTIPIGKGDDELVVDGETADFVIASPTRNIVYAMQAAVKKGDDKRADDILMANCVKWGNKDLLKEDEVFFALSKAIADITATKQKAVKNL